MLGRSSGGMSLPLCTYISHCSRGPLQSGEPSLTTIPIPLYPGRTTADQLDEEKRKRQRLEEESSKRRQDEEARSIQLARLLQELNEASDRVTSMEGQATELKKQLADKEKEIDEQR